MWWGTWLSTPGTEPSKTTAECYFQHHAANCKPSDNFMSKTDLENKISGDSFAITENVLSKDKDFDSS